MVQGWHAHFYGGHKLVNQNNAMFNPIWNNLTDSRRALIERYTTQASALDATPWGDVPVMPNIETLRIDVCGSSGWPVITQDSEIANTTSESTCPDACQAGRWKHGLHFHKQASLSQMSPAKQAKFLPTDHNDSRLHFPKTCRIRLHILSSCHKVIGELITGCQIEYHRVSFDFQFSSSPAFRLDLLSSVDRKVPRKDWSRRMGKYARNTGAVSA